MGLVEIRLNPVDTSPATEKLSPRTSNLHWSIRVFLHLRRILCISLQLKPFYAAFSTISRQTVGGTIGDIGTDAAHLTEYEKAQALSPAGHGAALIPNDLDNEVHRSKRDTWVDDGVNAHDLDFAVLNNLDSSTLLLPVLFSESCTCRAFSLMQALGGAMTNVPHGTFASSYDEPSPFRPEVLGGICGLW